MEFNEIARMQRKRKPLSQLTLEDQIVREKRPKNASADSSSSAEQSAQARAGTVSRMVLKNFMCHSHLEVTFNNNINYVIGRNGSGKSAILTALVVGLGGKASLTNRGNSIKGFIKAGKNGSTVEVTLRNEGPMAYRSNVYGNEITVVRNFSAAGSSSYKIKSSAGATVTTQSKEVQRICSNLNIQIDNPVCLLNQDTSRNFLNTKDPRQKFILFMRATRLETLYEEYKKVLNNKKSAARMLKEKEVLYNELREELNELKRKMESHKTVINLRQKVVLLQREVVWAKVRDSEEDMQQQEETVNQLEGEASEIRHQMANEQKNNSGLENTVQELQRQISDLQNSIEEQNHPQNTLVHALGELKESVNEKRREKRVMLKDIAVKTGNCNILEQEIKKVTENFAQLEEEKNNRLQEMSTLEEKIRAIEGLLATSKNDQFQMRSSLSRLHEEEQSLLSEISQTDAQTSNTNSRLSSFKGESNNVLSIYGRDMPRVVEAIKAAEKKFTHLPRGPLGSYITLKDKKWDVAVEGFLSAGMLRAFAVDNKKDNQLLMQIFDKVWSGGSKPMVITSKFFFEKHNVSANLVEPVDGCMSIYSALDISDPVVANCLVDQTSLESVLLIPNTNKAIELMSDRRRVPRHCRQGITMAGDKYFPDPNYKTYGSRYHNAQFLQVSTADVIQQLKQKLHELADRKKSINNQYKSVKSEFQEQNQKMKELEVKVAKLTRAQLHLKRQYDDLKNVVEPDVANVHMLENELAELKQVVEQRKVISEKIESDYGELKQKIEKKEEQLDRIKHIVRGYEDRIEPLHQQIRDHQGRRKEYDVNKRFATRRLEECKNRIRLARSALLEKTKLVEQKSQEASTAGERLEHLRQVNIIMEELKTNQRAIRQIESDIESAEEISKKYHDCSERYKQASEFMKAMSADVTELQVAAEKCNKYYDHTEEYFVTYVRHSFRKVLELRQFRGNIEINMDEKKLDLVVIPQQGSQGFTTTSNLSGGERSFSTVAFLYALWQCMEFPFYFLDEFDVFMDKVNRTKVMEILLYHAKSCPDLQFVFLTPQDVSFVHDKAVAIHRLEDPERSIVGSD